MHSLLQARQATRHADKRDTGTCVINRATTCNLKANHEFGGRLINKLSRLAIAFTTLALLASCASNNYRPNDVEIRDALPQGTDLEDNGEFARIDDDPVLIASDVDDEQHARQALKAEYYQRLAEQESDAQKQIEDILSSAEYFVQANQHQRAAELVLAIRSRLNTVEQQHRAIVVLAYADYANQYYQRALLRLEPLIQYSTNTLDNPEGNDDAAPLPSQSADNDKMLGDQTDAQPERTYIDANKALRQQERLTVQQVDALLLSSFCHQGLGNYEQAIAVLIRREAALYGSARAETTRYIWQVISTMPDQQREAVLQRSANLQVRSRIQQSLTGEIGGATLAPQQFNQWREELAMTSPSTILDSQWGPNSPRSVYVLLPFSSRFDTASRAVKAGIDREHELNQSSYRPSLHYYDIGDNPLQVGQYYAAAVRAGADFIIGPIGRAFSNEANNNSAYFNNTGYRNSYSDTRAPMLMLGGDQTVSAGNLRLSMNPEIEGRHVAERAWQDGHLSAGVLLPNSESGRRVLAGFSQRWLSLGGKMGKTIEYSPQQYDHSTELKQLFAINSSEYRHSRLSRVLGFKPKFSPYQRGDIDFVLMVADYKTGRIVRPQINFFTNSQLPVYSTSSIYNGIEDKINNMDLDRTRFPVMPWVVRSGKVTQYAGKLNMLQAMGMDAYRVAGNLSMLRSNPDAAIRGHTGQLQLHANSEIVYQPAWAKFVQGELEVIDSKGSDMSPLDSESSAELNGDLRNRPYGESGEGGRNSRGSYNEQNWDSRESRRKVGSQTP